MKYFVIDVFTDKLFNGNPAGICLLDSWLSDSIMQKIAFENNLAETAFLVEQDGHYDLRWFTPRVEIDLCGHATLGSAYVLMNYVDKLSEHIEFHTKSGVLCVERKKEIYIMDFPKRKPIPCRIPDFLEEALNVKVIETHKSRDLLVLLEKESDVANLIPNIELLKKMDDVFAVIITAKGEQFDFVSRFFAPKAGIDEDPVTGSSHSTLIPFWSEKLNKIDMIARQLSARGGTLFCKNDSERVKIGGTAVCYLRGDISL